MARPRRKPEIVVRDGEPTAVILGIDEYRELLERVEDLEDLRALDKLRQRPLQFTTLDEFLRKQRPSA
jgi:PHD/YefM family antitoxin component YafN of YafNO toxin-antitoxin module